MHNLQQRCTQNTCSKRNPIYASCHPPGLHLEPTSCLYGSAYFIAGTVQSEIFVSGFSPSIMFKIHPHCSTDQYFMSSYCQSIFHCMDEHTLSVHLLMDFWAVSPFPFFPPLKLFPLLMDFWVVNDTAVNICTQVSVWISFPVTLNNKST